MTGSNRPALRAGATPKNTPTAADTPNASATDHQVTEAGTGVSAWMVTAQIGRAHV